MVLSCPLRKLQRKNSRWFAWNDPKAKVPFSYILFFSVWIFREPTFFYPFPLFF